MRISDWSSDVCSSDLRHVDAHHAGPNTAEKGLRRIAVAGEGRGAVSELMGVDEAKRLVEALGAHDREHRPEYLLAVDAHLGRHLVEQRAADEEALLIALDVEPASVDHQLSAFGHACVDIALHLVGKFPRHERRAE